MTRTGFVACLGLAGFGLACASPGLRAGAAAVVTVIQAHRAFGVPSIHIKRGDTVDFTNEDSFNHQIFVRAPGFTFESAEQPPGETVQTKFTATGLFDVQCAIHPRMHLAVTVD